MNPAYIEGIGVISRCACASNELYDLLKTENTAGYGGTEKISYDSVVPSSKVRRCSSYTRLAVEASERSVHDSGLTDNCDKLRIGTIITSGYGAIESSIKFADSAVKRNPANCSPAVFSNTVPNSCVGQICMVGGYKGVSTFLMGGDPLEYAALLLQTNKADRILCGSVESYFKELFDSVLSCGAAKGIDICEGASVLTVSAEKTARAYCAVAAFGSAAFSAYPYVHKITEEEGVQTICGALEQIGGDIPDVIFTSENGSYFDSIEFKTLKKRSGNAAFIRPKKYFGETLGSGYMLSISLAAAALKNRDFSMKYRSALVTGTDAAGNYLCCKLEAV